MLILNNIIFLERVLIVVCLFTDHNIWRFNSVSSTPGFSGAFLITSYVSTTIFYIRRKSYTAVRAKTILFPPT